MILYFKMSFLLQSEVPSGSGNTLAASLRGWAAAGGDPRGPGTMYIDRVPWPENKGCAGLGELGAVGNSEGASR